MRTANDGADRPREATALAILLLLEAAGMLVLAGWLVFEAIVLDRTQLGATLFLAALAAGSAFFLLQAGRGVLDGRSWSRSATVVWQVLQVGIAVGTYNGAEGPVPLALALFVPAVVALVLVFRKPTREWLARERQQQA